MMNDFHLNNKFSGVYWLKKSLTDVKIRIKLKPEDALLSLPKFEEYANESNRSSLQIENRIEEFQFTWQEKVFSSWELQRYSDVHNCISETELTYYDMIKSKEYESSKVHTYIHSDYYLPLPENRMEANDYSFLGKCFEKLSLKGLRKEDTTSMGHLFRSQEDVFCDTEQWMAMHVVFDNSEYNEDSQLLLKQEAVLLSLYHNISQGYLIISPNTNDLESKPYRVGTVAGDQWAFQYAVDIDLTGQACGDELMTLLKKLKKKNETKKKSLLNFKTPPLGKKQYFITFEILTAHNFDEDNLYIEYNIKIPDGIGCSDPVKGKTHTSRAMRVDDDTAACHYGHVVALVMDMPDDGSDPPPIKFFFEVISRDWWDSHRTEGYSYLPLTLVPGHYSKQLSCSRPEEMDAVQAESRRFFLGGCNLIKDLDVLANPQLQDSNFKLKSTGTITVRWNTIVAKSLSTSYHPQPGTSSASALLRAAETALRKYRNARDRLADAGGDG